MSSPEKRKMTTTEIPSLQSTPIPSLPDDLLLSCFARASRLYYPTLSLVSKSFQYLLTLPELYRNRSVVNRTESCLYVCLNLPPDPNPRWFTLTRKPNKTLINHIPKKSSKSGNLLIPISIPQSPRKCVVAFGSSIYAFSEESESHRKYPIPAGSRIYHNIIAKDYSPSVSILDCRTHKWRDGPRMRVWRDRPSANVVDGKIYVAGGCKDYYSSNWMEVFDPKTQSWEIVASTFAQRRFSDVYTSGVIDGDIYMFGNGKGVVYKPKEDRWEAIRFPECYEVDWFSWCVIDNVLYGYSFREGIQWYNFTLGEWNTLIGYVRFPGLPKTRSSHVRLVDCGGKMAVLWDENPPLVFRRSVQCEEETTELNRILWCGVIKLKKLNCDEISGVVEWFDPVLTVPSSYVIEHALSATV